MNFNANWKEKQRWGFCVTTAHLQCYQIMIWRSATNEYNFVLAKHVDFCFACCTKGYSVPVPGNEVPSTQFFVCELSFGNEHVDKYLNWKGQKRKYPTSKHTEITPLTIARCFNHRMEIEFLFNLFTFSIEPPHHRKCTYFQCDIWCDCTFCLFVCCDDNECETKTARRKERERKKSRWRLSVFVFVERQYRI